MKTEHPSITVEQFGALLKRLGLAPLSDLAPGTVVAVGVIPNDPAATTQPPVVMKVV